MHIKFAPSVSSRVVPNFNGTTCSRSSSFYVFAELKHVDVIDIFRNNIIMIFNGR